MSEDQKTKVYHAAGLGLNSRSERYHDKKMLLSADFQHSFSNKIIKNLKTSGEITKKFFYHRNEMKKFIYKKDINNYRAYSRKYRDEIQNNYFDEASHRLEMAIRAPCGFGERVVYFLSNSICVSMKSDGLTRYLAGAFEREAIRRHSLGGLGDLIFATSVHPAMLRYLNQDISVGRNSEFGRLKRKGMNENLAREILELHLLGVDGGYSQSDVRNLAMALTGWTLNESGPEGSESGSIFLAERHEPGKKEIFGKNYENPKDGEIKEIINDISRRRESYEYFSKRICRYFFGDKSNKNIENNVINIMKKNDGKLKDVYSYIFYEINDENEASGEVISPFEFIAKACRSLGVQAVGGRVVDSMMKRMGQPLWSPPTPKGFNWSEMEMVSPMAILARLEISALIVQLSDVLQDPENFARKQWGESGLQYLQPHLAGAATRQQGLVTMLMSRQFQRR